MAAVSVGALKRYNDKLAHENDVLKERLWHIQSRPTGSYSKVFRDINKKYWAMYDKVRSSVEFGDGYLLCFGFVNNNFSICWKRPNTPPTAIAYIDIEKLLAAIDRSEIKKGPVQLGSAMNDISLTVDEGIISFSVHFKIEGADYFIEFEREKTDFVTVLKGLAVYYEEQAKALDDDESKNELRAAAEIMARR
tara:strand:+ start:1434 stop:2012 length:579 start_codon:yes stop_codon:yes gene_type:complete